MPNEFASENSVVDLTDAGSAPAAEPAAKKPGRKPAAKPAAPRGKKKS